MSRSLGIRARSGLLGLAIALAAAAASAKDTALYGVATVRFAWTPAAGTPVGYQVSVSNRGAPLTAYRWVTQPNVILPVSPGNQIRIAVAAGGYDRNGVFRLGPQSVLSDGVWIFRAPVFDVAGTWLLQCASCPSLALRSLADASVIEAEAPGLPEPWRAVGRATLESGPDLIVWSNRFTGEMKLWDSLDLVPIPGGTAVGPRFVRAVGAADFDGDGIEEFVFQQLPTYDVSVWGLTPGGFEHVGSLPGPEALLAAVEDLTGDGRIELLWHDPTAGTVDVVTVIGDPRFANSPSSLYQLPRRRLASGFADASLADTGDYDGDGEIDLLWRGSDGRLVILYLIDGQLHRFGMPPAREGDADRWVVGSAEVDGVAGDEIALQDSYTSAISFLLPTYPAALARINVLNPGSGWSVVDIAE